MTVTELTKEIYEKYPKVWEKITYYLNHKLFNENDKDSDMVIVITSDPYIIIDDGYDSIIPFSMLYGLLEDFFEDNNIEIIIKKTHYTHPDPYIIDIFYYNNLINFGAFSNYQKTKNEAKYQAILKACEILEDKL